MEIVLVAIHVEKMKETVIMTMIAKKVTNVELIIAEVHWVSIFNMTAAIIQRKIFAHFKVPVVLIKEIVIHMMFAKVVLYVVSTIVLDPLVMTC